MKIHVMAELGLGHQGVLGEALALILAASEAGADAVKLQDHRWQEHRAYAEHPPWFNARRSSETREEYLRRTSFGEDAWRRIAQEVHHWGRELVVSPFSARAARELVDVVDRYKVASGQVTNATLLETLREIGKPVILSSGLATRAELERAQEQLGQSLWVTLQCTSEYPCPSEHVGLSALREGWCDGLSDHTLGTSASVGAIMLGAKVIERHVGWDRRQYGSDARHSLTIDEFAAFVHEVRDLEMMLNANYDKDTRARELVETRKAFLYGAA